MSWTNRSVLVTGAGGFIGSHLTERLANEGANVRALIHYNSAGTHGWLEDSSVVKDIQLIAGDICDRDRLREAMQGVSVVFHLAALIAIPYSYTAPASYVRTNVEGTLNVLQTARELGIERVIHTSTSEVYGTARYVPMDEDHPLQGQSPYSASKIGADKIAESFYLSFGLPVVTVRPFNTFGPRQSARAVIPTIITQCLNGDIVNLGNVHPTRDFSYVLNTVDGFMAAAASAEAIGKTINLGSNREISITDLVNLVVEQIGRPVTIKTDKQRVRPKASEVERLYADNTLARTLLAWEPRVSLEEGLKHTIDWLRERLEHYQADVYAI
jgi:NAD dependent epimerase/dehydratase